MNALAAGQILWEVLDCYPAANQEARNGLLWKHIEKIYEDTNTPQSQRLAKQNLKDYKKPNKAAELDVKAAACPHFVPVLPRLTSENEFNSGTNKQKARSTM